jgi:hypothetical protein
MSLDNLSTEDQRKLNEFMNQGLAVLQEISDLREGLRDTAKTLAEQWEVKPAVLNKALTTAFKSTLEAQQEDMANVESVLVYTGRA